MSTGDDTTTFQEIVDRFNQASVLESKHGELNSIILNPLIKTVSKTGPAQKSVRATDVHHGCLSLDICFMQRTLSIATVIPTEL